MKTFTALSLAAVSLALMTGCSAPAPGGETAGAASVAGTPGKTMEDFREGAYSDDLFYSVIRKGTATLGSYSDDELVGIVRTVCAGAANGQTERDALLSQAASAVSRNGSDLTGKAGRDIGYLIGVGSQNYCPDSMDMLQTLFNS
ncbi:MAG TPA: DUF732 domain-containing protein [Arthrobacter sp.]